MSRLSKNMFIGWIEKEMLKRNPAFVLGMFETGLAVGRSLGRKGVKVIGLDFKKDIGFYSRYILGQLCPHPIEKEQEFIDFLDSEVVQNQLEKVCIKKNYKKNSYVSKCFILAEVIFGSNYNYEYGVTDYETILNPIKIFDVSF